VYCTHFEDGCKSSFKRKEEQKHYLEYAAQHARLVKQKVARLERKVTDLERSAQEAQATLGAALQGGLAFQEGTEFDCRDHVGMWLKAKVVKRQQSGVGSGSMTRVFVHFTNWDSKWDEWIRTDTDFYRFAPLGFYTLQDYSRANFKFGERVEVYITRPSPRKWRPAVVRKVHRQQIKVEYYSEGRRHEYWFHNKSMEIRSLAEGAPSAYDEVSPSSPLRPPIQLRTSSSSSMEPSESVDV